MCADRFHQYVASRLLWLAMAALLMRPLGAAGVTEETFDVIQIGTHAYTNATVTTKAKSYIFIMHAGGMASIKVAQLPPDVRKKLGYADPSAPKEATNGPAVWMKKGIAKLDAPQIKEFRNQIEQNWRNQSTPRLTAMGLIGPKLNWTVLGIVLLICVSVYLFHCYCSMLICRKAGHPPGFLVWVPLLQLLPMLRAAGMSRWWFVAYFVPLLNFVPSILWCFKIAKARGKSLWIGVLLLLPVTNLFAFLYLAFSDGPDSGDDQGPEPKVMSLQAV
jgi:hypothetical protein